ncbi:Ribosome-recycling factor, mitochondrial [Takifugu flavidus]|uniref:Ribosome-recycling factor, mitochondrial n=1 Tax=Takifugu flavidus TaxID=433684 RepID=A0A5C6NEQ3_9TELE|nr:Ribosome-recycling factor, mitochondrial [Takifugu flavidus]
MQPILEAPGLRCGGVEVCGGAPQLAPGLLTAEVRLQLLPRRLSQPKCAGCSLAEFTLRQPDYEDSYGSESAEPAASSAAATAQVSPRGHLQAPAAPPLPACGLRLYATKKAKAKAKGQSAKLNINAALVEDIVDLGALRAEMAAVVGALKDDFTRSLSIRTSLGLDPSPLDLREQEGGGQGGSECSTVWLPLAPYFHPPVSSSPSRPSLRSLIRSSPHPPPFCAAARLGALDHILVTTGDGKFPLNQLGQISMKSPQLIIINMSSFPEDLAPAPPSACCLELPMLLGPDGRSRSGCQNHVFPRSRRLEPPVQENLLGSSRLLFPSGFRGTAGAERPPDVVARPDLSEGRKQRFGKPGASCRTGFRPAAAGRSTPETLATAAATLALRESSMNLNPEVEGTVIRVPVPKVTREHRENLAKVAKQLANKAKESLRRVRSGAVTQAKRTKEGHSEDTVRLVEKQIQQLSDNTAAEVDKLLAAKTKELLG